MGLKAKGQASVIKAIQERQPFVQASMKGGAPSFFPCAGQLPQPHREAYYQAVKAHGQALYVVWSYGTPIAWVGPDLIPVIPAHTYSRTTTHHQGLAAQGMNAILCGAVQEEVAA